MKKIVLLLAGLALMAMASNVSAFTWQMYDFGSGPFDHNNNYCSIYYPHHVGNYPSPGYLTEGGEKFDLEGFFFKTQGNTAHIALTNSFGYSAHSTSWNRDYRLGDIFFGFDGNSCQYAIDVSEGKLYEVLAYDGIPDRPGTYHDYPAISTAAGAWQISNGIELASIDHSLTFWEDLETNPMQGSGDTYVWEFSFDMNLLNGFRGARTVSFHNTLECGNDVINEQFGVIPEPSAIILMGLGLLGMGAYRKFRK